MLSISARLKYDTTFFVAFDASLLDAPVSKLRVLDLTFECSVAPSTLLLALSSLPNLVSLSVKMRSITSYNEDLFIARIEGIEERFQHLEQLEITFYDHPPTMTGKTIVAILRKSPKLVQFDNTFKFLVSEEDLRQLRDIAAERNLRLIYSFKAITMKQFSCFNGRHEPVPEFYIEDSQAVVDFAEINLDHLDHAQPVSQPEEV